MHIQPHSINTQLIRPTVVLDVNLLEDGAGSDEVKYQYLFISTSGVLAVAYVLIWETRQMLLPALVLEIIEP